MRTYEGGLAVLEHYMRRVDEDENDGRESTKILGVLRAAALKKLEWYYTRVMYHVMY